MLCVLSVVVYVGDHHTERYDQSERRDPERESKREREFCVQFSLIGKETLAVSPLCCAPGLEKEGKIKRKFKFEHTSYHQTDRHIIIALDCNNRREREREREESTFERVVF